MVRNIKFILFLLLIVELSACSSQTQPDEELSNPATDYCLDQGGTLQFEERGDRGEIGVCYFDDNRQCEEWAMLRGDCSVGGGEGYRVHHTGSPLLRHHWWRLPDHRRRGSRN